MFYTVDVKYTVVRIRSLKCLGGTGFTEGIDRDHIKLKAQTLNFLHKNGHYVINIAKRFQ